VVGLRGRTADNVGTAPQVLAYNICSGVARHFLAVGAYAVWRPNRGDWQFTFYISMIVFLASWLIFHFFQSRPDF